MPAAHLHHAEGSVAYAPQGDKEWHDVQPRRLLKRGDRLWTDRGSRAEVQAGGHALRLNSETQLVLENVGETATQLSLTQGSIVATVTRMNPGDSFEVGTPNLAFRARQPGDYRIDVDTKQGVTRLVVLSGLAVVYGEKGEAMEVRTGQRATFRERSLARVQQPLFAATDEFDRWAGARRRGEPTVSMPVIGRAAPPPSPATAFVNKGRDIVIAGSAADVAASTGIPARGSMRMLAPRTPVPAAQVAPAVPGEKSIATSTLQAPASAKPIPTITTTTAQAAPSAKPIPTTSVQAAPLKVMIPSAPAPATSAQIKAQMQAAQVQAAQAHAAQAQAAQAQAEAAADALAARARAAAQAQVQARAAAQAQAAAREQQDRQRRLVAQQREEDRRAAARAEQEKRSAAVAEAKRTAERRRAVLARRAEDDRHHANVKRETEQKRVAATKHAEEERRHAMAKRVAEEKRLIAVRKAETQKIIDAQKLAESRRLQLARLQEQARRDEQSVQARREQQSRRADEAGREEQARRDDAARREEQARREEDYRRQRALADQARRDQARRDEEVWLRQQQQTPPARPVPMGVPIRRVS